MRYSRRLKSPQEILRRYSSPWAVKPKYRKIFIRKETSHADRKKIPTASATEGMPRRIFPPRRVVVSVILSSETFIISWAMSPPLKKKVAI
ncbi:MAG: hypothetical protein K2J08_08750 [Ruminococcus sp.]|nr:hypothetical protein [Ruminococcus sp.]